MEVLLDKKSATNAAVTVSLKSEDYQPQIDKSIKDLSKRANLKGFRPGKVPTQVIKRMYGKGILVDEVNKIVSTALNEYIQGNKLQVVGDPQIVREKAEAIDWDKQTDFDFEYEIGLASDFELNLSDFPAVPAYTIIAGDKEIEEAIENMGKQFSEQIHAETSEAGDMLYGELKQVEGAFTTKTAIPFRQIKEDAQDKFIGLAKGSSVLFDLREAFADNKTIGLLTGQKEEDAAKLEGQFEFAVEDITRDGKPELNQVFFDKVLGPGKATDEADFRAQVLGIINSNYVREGDGLLNFEIERALLENVKIDLPDEFLKNWLLLMNEGKFTMEQIEADYPQFTKSLKLSLIKNKIADAGGIKVEFAEILERTEAMVREQFGFYGNEMGDQMNDTIKKIAQNYLTDDKRENYTKMFNTVYDGKVFDYVKSQLSFDRKEVSFEQFKEIVDSLPQQ